MEIEVRPKNYSESDEGQSFAERCTVIVKTTDDNGNVAEAEEKGCIIQGEEMVFLNAENVYLPNLPTERQDIAGAFEEVLGKLQDGEGGDWQPPDWWIPVPEPEPYDIYALVNAFETPYGISMILTDTNFSGGNGTIACDWGDGTEENITGQSRISHTYSNSGQFLIHIICTDENNFISSLSESPYGVYYLIIKTGSEIFWAKENEWGLSRVTYTKTAMFNALKSLTILNSNGIIAGDKAVYLGRMQVLQKFDCIKMSVANLNADSGFLEGNDTSVKNMKNILKNFDLTKCTTIKKYSRYDSGRGFYNNVNLKEIELPNCTYIDTQMFSYCVNLEKIIAPKCTYVGDQAFSYCYNLQEVQFAENCVFGTNCFQGCKCLYPLPNDTVN